MFPIKHIHVGKALARELHEVGNHVRTLKDVILHNASVKAGAYVKQKLGFADVRRLEKGVVHYERWLEDSGAETRFRGENFVFDKRATADDGKNPDG